MALFLVALPMFSRLFGCLGIPFFFVNDSSTIFNDNLLQGHGSILRSAFHVYHFLDRFHARHDPSKSRVLSIQMGCRLERHEKLRSIGIGPRIGHAQNTFSIVLVAAMLVLPVAPVQGAKASGPIKTLPISGLDAKAWHDAMKLTAAIRWLGIFRAGANIVAAERQKGLTGFGIIGCVQFHHDIIFQDLSADRYLQKALDKLAFRSTITHLYGMKSSDPVVPGKMKNQLSFHGWQGFEDCGELLILFIKNDFHFLSLDFERANPANDSID